MALIAAVVNVAWVDADGGTGSTQLRSSTRVDGTRELLDRVERPLRVPRRGAPVLFGVVAEVFYGEGVRTVRTTAYRFDPETGEPAIVEVSEREERE